MQFTQIIYYCRKFSNQFSIASVNCWGLNQRQKVVAYSTLGEYAQAQFTSCVYACVLYFFIYLFIFLSFWISL